MSAQPVASALPAAASAFGAPSFTKYDADGTVLPADASSWAFVRVALGEHAFDVLPADVGAKRLTFAAAQQACADLDVLGSRDWRLPTISELEALRDFTQSGPAANPEYFPNLRPNFYWSGTVLAASPADSAWLVYFYHGNSYCYDQSGTAFVRAVRSVVPAGQ